MNNERALDGLFDANDLPRASVTGMADGVLVTVGRADDLLPWLNLLPGTIFRSPAMCNFELWVLNTELETGDPTVPLLPLFVACSVPVGEPVAWDVAQAVAA